MIAQEDTLFYFECEMHEPIIIKFDAPCYLYRQRKSSIMHSKSDKRNIAYYQSMKVMLDVYRYYELNNKCKDRERINSLVLRSKENVAFCLAKVCDTNFVKEQMKELKQNGDYPYPIQREALRRKMSVPLRFISYLLPFRSMFWIAHYGFKFIQRNIQSDFN